MQQKKTAGRLTKVERATLEALASGEVMTVDRSNMSWIGTRPVQFNTRSGLTSKRLITRLDQSKPADAPGNGFVISDKGKAALA